MALTAVPNSSSQSVTQSPQATSVATFGASQSSGGVQPGTAADLLRSQNGIQLSNTSLSTVSLGSASAASTTASSTPAPPKHHINVPLLGFAALLIVAAAVMFWTAGRSVKTTT